MLIFQNMLHVATLRVSPPRTNFGVNNDASMFVFLVASLDIKVLL